VNPLALAIQAGQHGPMHRRGSQPDSRGRRWCRAAAVAGVAWASFGLANAKGPSAPEAAPCPERPITVAFYEFGALYQAAGGVVDGFTGRGIDVDLLRELRHRSGCRFEGMVMTRARIWSELEAGRLDMTTSGIATPEREKRYAFAPYIQLKHHVWMLQSHPPVQGGLDGFMSEPRLRWGAVRGYRHTPAYDAALDQARSQGRVVEATDDAQLLRLLAEGTVDAVVGHAVVLRRYAAEHPRQPQIVALDWAPQASVASEGLVLSRARFSEADIGWWRALVHELVRDGTLARILRRHVPPDEVMGMLPRD
jgi:polar amino acid transport system substrate-binding protein